MMHNNRRFDSTGKELMNYIDHDVNLWDELLYITGGLLEHLKTNYNLMVWNFEEKGKPYVTSNAQLPSNKVKLQQKGIETTLKQVDVNKAVQNLGASGNIPTTRNRTRSIER
eukprot:12485825-Ditylum_brightwellii.AAC.1